MDDDHEADQVQPSAAELLGPRNAQETEFAHLPNVVPGKGCVGVMLRGDRGNFVAGELTHHLAGREVLLREIQCVVHSQAASVSSEERSTSRNFSPYRSSFTGP